VGRIVVAEPAEADPFFVVVGLAAIVEQAGPDSAFGEILVASSAVVGTLTAVDNTEKRVGRKSSEIIHRTRRYRCHHLHRC
jgi:hypothetical protein